MQFIKTLLHILPVQCTFSAASVRTAYNWSKWNTLRLQMLGHWNHFRFDCVCKIVYTYSSSPMPVLCWFSSDSLQLVQTPKRNKLGPPRLQMSGCWNHYRLVENVYINFYTFFYAKVYTKIYANVENVATNSTLFIR